MTDLRTRIYDIVWRELEYDGDDFCGHLADVLIRELGLQQEWSIGNDDDGRVLWLDGEQPIPPRDGEVVETRHVTDWTTDG